MHKLTVLSPRLQIIEHLKTESLTYLRSADSWVLGLLFLKQAKRGTTRTSGIQNSSFSESQNPWRGGGWQVYQRLADALIGFNLTTWHSAQLRRLQPSTILFESQNGLARLRDCKIILNYNCSSYAVEDAVHWGWARNEPVLSLYVQCSSYTSGREPRVLFKMLRNYTSQYKYSELHYVSLRCNLPTATVIFLAPLRASSI